LLRAYEEQASFLESPPPVGGIPTIDQPASESLGAVIGPYKLIEQIGEGGMGTVWMAQQQEPVKRLVALKLIKAGMDSKQVLARFEAERQALALMDHPNIARVLDGGTTSRGRPYFVMELVKGVPITEFCDQNHLTPRQRLELFIPVCQAVQHAHQKGIIHRDLKPSNVLVSRHDTTPTVKVIDFGVAKALGQELTDKTLFTGLAQMVGTPLYMSPEQAGMSDLDVDTRSDIYSLGVLLYELLTGTTPLDKERLGKAGYDEIRRIIREEEPARPSTRISTLGQAATAVSTNRQSDPRRLSQLVRGELDWIVMKALEKDRNRRYETASAFAADVQRYLHDEPVQACPPSTLYRLRKFARRNKAALLSASAVVVAVSLAVAVSTVLIWQALERERREANFHRITLAHQDLSADNLGRALKLLEACPEDLREWEWHYLMRLCKVEPLVIRDRTAVNGVAFSPDGERLAAAGGDGAVKIWNSRTGKEVQAFKAHTDSVVSVAFHPDGMHVASAGTDRKVKVWDWTTGQEVFSGPCDALRPFGAAYTVAFGPPDGQQLAAGSDGTVRVWDWKGRQLLHTFPGHENHSIPVAFSRDGRRLVTGGAFQEGQRLWDPNTGQLLRTIDTHREPVSALAFSPDGGRVASASFDKSVKLWDTTTGGLLRTLSHTGKVLGVAFSPDGRRLASGGDDKTVRVWDATTGREVLGLRGHTDMCACVAFSPDGRRLASASADGTIRFWDATPLRGDEGQETLTFTGHGVEIRSVAFSPDGQTIASAGLGPPVKVWNATTGRLTVGFNAHTVGIFCSAWHPDGQRIATAGGDLPLHTVKVWDARTGRQAFELQAGRETLAGAWHAVAFSPDGRNLDTGKKKA
jgi:WD40 repeat protein/serine/threonine protein kinase